MTKENFVTTNWFETHLWSKFYTTEKINLLEKQQQNYWKKIKKNVHGNYFANKKIALSHLKLQSYCIMEMYTCSYSTKKILELKRVKIPA